MARKKPVGWRKEPVRHGLAAKGVKTKQPEKRMVRGRIPGSFNAFGKHGVLIKDPKGTVRLEGGGEYGLGAVPMPMPREAAEWLYMAELGIPYGEVRKAVKRDNPLLIVRTGDTEYRVRAMEGLD